MELKTYKARSMSEALALVKKDLGPDAVILGTRTLTRAGLLGLTSRSEIEIASSIRFGITRDGSGLSTSRTGALPITC